MWRETVNLLLFVPLAKGSPKGRKRPHVTTEEWTRGQRAGVKARLWAGKVAAALSEHPRLAGGGAAHLLERTLPALVLHAARAASSSSLRMILMSLLTSSAHPPRPCSPTHRAWLDDREQEALRWPPWGLSISMPAPNGVGLLGHCAPCPYQLPYAKGQHREEQETWPRQAGTGFWCWLFRKSYENGQALHQCTKGLLASSLRLSVSSFKHHRTWRLKDGLWSQTAPI